MGRANGFNAWSRNRNKNKNEKRKTRTATVRLKALHPVRTTSPTNSIVDSRLNGIGVEGEGKRKIEKKLKFSFPKKKKIGNARDSTVREQKLKVIAFNT